MNATIKTTPQAVSRAIGALGKGYERYSDTEGYGYRVSLSEWSPVVITVEHFTNSDTGRLDLTEDLAAAGFEIYTGSKRATNRGQFLEIVEVVGKIDYRAEMLADEKLERLFAAIEGN
jgi:hypothetical protein